jgi:hypothetical protein
MFQHECSYPVIARVPQELRGASILVGAALKIFGYFRLMCNVQILTTTPERFSLAKPSVAAFKRGLRNSFRRTVIPLDRS